MGDIKYECSLCEQTFSHKNYWRAHIRTHSQDRSHACDVCPSKFKARSDLGKHKKHVHSGTNRFPCKFCNATFKRASNLKLHTKVHLETETFTCAHCELLVTSKEFLEEHITHSHMQVVNTEDKAHKKRRKFSVPRGKLLFCNLCNEICFQM
uniref:Zinc finger protein 628 n=1 Tax=Cacopsylla melanoneura TaxID=428564 RepID=A0A8D8YZJ5_9HEMI